MAFADNEQKGRIQLLYFSDLNKSLFEERIIEVTNKQEVAGLSFSQDGSLLHVAVENGTSLHIYNVKKCELIKELGRGNTQANVNCIASDGEYMSCCSDRTTVHLFSIATGLAQPEKTE